ncbi:hypothetical protein ScPMuIL_017497 [Solemya velum]
MGMQEHRTDYEYGYIVEVLETNKTPCHSWVLLPGENLWPEALRGILYILALMYLFIGIAIASDIFMSSIEVITSKKKTLIRWDEEKKEKVKREVLIWNETVANLTLMALGSSAPEILLAVIETASTLGNQNEEDSLGTFTIIGSASFNLFIITSICIVSVPHPDVKRIREFGVFLITSFWSLWAYIWMLLVVKYITPGVIDWWEAWLTLGFMPMFVFMSYCQDNGWWLRKKEVRGIEDPEEENIRIVNMNRPRLGSFTSHTVPGKELHVLESEMSHRMRSEEEPNRVRQITTMENEYPPPPAIKTFAHARFRHAVVSAMKGSSKKNIDTEGDRLFDVVQRATALNDKMKEGKAPEGDLCGKFTFSSDRFAVLESAGILEVDVLLHRNMLPPHTDKGLIANGDGIIFRNGSAKVCPSIPEENEGVQTFLGVATVEYETREGSAKAGKDFRYMQDKLVFTENEFKKTITIDIINDNQYEADADFYIILKNAKGGSGLGDPSVTRVTIVDDDEPGEFYFENSHCFADMATGELSARVVREHGCDGEVTLEYSTIDGTATGGRDLKEGVDFQHAQGTVKFSHAETSKSIQIPVNKNVKCPRNFIIALRNPSLGAKIGIRSAIVCNINREDLDDRIARVLDDNQEGVSWVDQFVEAMSIEEDTDDDGNKISPTFLAFFMHFLTFFWKVLGACIPPTKYFGAWPSFVLSLVYIAVLTAFIDQLGHLLGCVIGLRVSVTGITIIALGTSLPDTFASRTAAKQDTHADAAIGNITGSNSVNVFLGLGLPWVMSTMYAWSKGTKHRVGTKNLAQNVTVFLSFGAFCILLLIIRRLLEVSCEHRTKNSTAGFGTEICNGKY